MSPMNNENILQAYRSFVQGMVKNYRQDYEVYFANGGKESFQKRYWWSMMHETVEEAENTLMNIKGEVPDKISLMKAMKQIAEEALFSSPSSEKKLSGSHSQNHPEQRGHQTALSF